MILYVLRSQICFHVRAVEVKRGADAFGVPGTYAVTVGGIEQRRWQEGSACRGAVSNPSINSQGSTKEAEDEVNQAGRPTPLGTRSVPLSLP